MEKIVKGDCVATFVVNNLLLLVLVWLIVVLLILDLVLMFQPLHREEFQDILER